MSLKGEIPVKYIIAIILAIVVLAILGYWLFISSGGFSGDLSLAKCKARLLTYCTGKSAKGEDPTKSDWESFEPGCKYLDWAVNTAVCEDVLKGIYPEA